MDNNKKGQLAIFVIIAIVIIGVIASFFVFRGRVDRIQYVSPEAQPVYDFIQSCMDNSLVNGSILIGYQGGYAEMPEKYLSLNFTDMGYGYYEGEKVLISKEELEGEIGKVVEYGTIGCFNPSENFPDWEVEMGDISSDVVVGEDKIIAYLNLDMVISKGETTARFDSFSSEFNIGLKEIHEAASKIVDKEVEDPENIDFDFLLNLDYDITIIPYSEDTYVYVIEDNNTLINNEPYRFMFANKLR